LPSEAGESLLFLGHPAHVPENGFFDPYTPAARAFLKLVLSDPDKEELCFAERAIESVLICGASGFRQGRTAVNALLHGNRNIPEATGTYLRGDEGPAVFTRNAFRDGCGTAVGAVPRFLEFLLFAHNRRPLNLRYASEFALRLISKDISGEKENFRR
jgi:hypothetical protein